MDGAAEGSDANEDLLDVGHHSLDVLLRKGPGLNSKGLILDEEYRVYRGIFKKSLRVFWISSSLPLTVWISQKPNKKKKGTTRRSDSLSRLGVLA